MPPASLFAIALTEDDRPVGDALLRTVPGWACDGLQAWPLAADVAVGDGLAVVGTDPIELPVAVAALRQRWRALPMLVIGPAAGSELETACLEAGADECTNPESLTPVAVAATLHRAQARRRACMSTTTLAAALESDVEAVWSVDRQYRLQLFNATFAKHYARSFGRSPLPGSSAFDQVPEDLVRRWQDWYDRALAGDSFAIRFQPVVDGIQRTVEAQMRPLTINGVIVGARCASQDVTDRIAAEAARQHLEQNLQAIIDGSTDAVYTVDRDLRLTSFNRAFADGFFIQFQRQPVLGEPALSEADPEQTDTFRAAYAQALAGQAGELEFAFMLRGQEIIADVTLNPIVTDAGVTGVWCVWKDITARKAHEESLRRAKEAAEAATQAKGDFLAVMSHEIRTPLHAVLGLTDLLLETALNADQRDYAESLHQSAGTLATMIDDILDYSKLEAGKLALHVEPLEIDALITEVAEPMAVRAFEKGLDFTLYLDPTLPQEVVTDGNRLRQVLLNLLGNALKFTDAGAIGLEVHCRCHGTPGRCNLEVIVRDTGIGIPDDKQANLFQRFSQADTSTTRRFGGTGLGLAISQELLALMGGEIVLESAEGVGSTFRFQLEVAITDTTTASLGPSGRRILVIACHEPRRQALQAYAEFWGADLRMAASAVEAAAWLAETDWRPDLVLVGWQAHVANAALPHGPTPRSWGVPTVLLLPVRMRRNRRRKLAMGYSDCILDPATPSLLGPRLEVMLAGPERSPEPTGGRHDVPVAPPRCGRVLVVDDNAINLKMAARMLERLGCQVETAQSGSEAIARVGRSPFDLIFMDCQMPETDGFQATRAIRQLPEGREVPIIAVTAYALPGDRDRCLQAGMNDYLSKPVRRESLQAMLERWLSPPEAEAAEVVIDQDRLMTLVDGDVDLLAELVATYLAEAPAMQRNLRQAGHQGDAVALARAAHTLKGALINLAAEKPAEMAKAIELSARQGETERAVGLLPTLDGMLDRLPERLQALLS